MTGETPNHSSKTKWSPLHRAVERQHNEVAVALIASGANPNIQTETSGDSVLHLAAMKNEAMTAELLKAGADPTVKNKCGWTPLHTAMFYGSASAVRILLRTPGVNREARDNLGRTPEDLVNAQKGYSLKDFPKHLSSVPQSRVSPRVARARKPGAASSRTRPGPQIPRSAANTDVQSPGARRLADALASRGERCREENSR
jgi:hypothetical protein